MGGYFFVSNIVSSDWEQNTYDDFGLPIYAEGSVSEGSPLVKIGDKIKYDQPLFRISLVSSIILR